MERRRFISDCVTKAAEELGYQTMKMEQLDVAIAFVEGRDVFVIRGGRARPSKRSGDVM